MPVVTFTNLYSKKYLTILEMDEGAYVSTCLYHLRAYLPTCLCLLCDYVPTFLCVFMCLHVYLFYMPMVSVCVYSIKCLPELRKWNQIGKHVFNLFVM